MIYLILLIIVLIVVAIFSLLAARRASVRAGLPSGKLIYSDTGFPVGKVGGVSRNPEGVRQEKPLVSRRYGLTGRPDYLVRTEEGIVPVEAKSAKSPAGGRAYPSHVMQLAAYCLLVEDALSAEVPYGIIRYADREIVVDYTPELKDELTTLLYEMREARVAEDVHRSHTDFQRCDKCSMREICTESLA